MGPNTIRGSTSREQLESAIRLRQDRFGPVLTFLGVVLIGVSLVHAPALERLLNVIVAPYIEVRSNWESNRRCLSGLVEASGLAERNAQRVTLVIPVTDEFSGPVNASIKWALNGNAQPIPQPEVLGFPGERHIAVPIGTLLNKVPVNVEVCTPTSEYRLDIDVSR